ncbi:CBM96 family carbohydrate-binding protein [Flammeovirga kamogawensis]|uniref:DNRLRE domain-containing protein n=1 Tax=Flammeovirga kamogawensis TaxID=373891 RepID=A0ABX8H518_9BACT|nr:DNRLRE domain-containing protein [Flammeovirga kamogawensis]MBB6461865.1 hypothetical protein [Flammeovirga kamogawensis]QWG10521.1 DNRLRE domain-containing protein [Flammeovirga kamogawensis]TRX63630.1 DNRLRE domain-containing protein [Flammeovirga kamogawensis]
MKTRIFILLFSLGMVSLVQAGEPKNGGKIKVKQDAYVECGESSVKTMGSTQSNKLRVGNVKKENKYSRRTYLKFSMKNIDGLDNANFIVLHVYGKAFSKQTDKNAIIDVHTVLSNKWNEESITWKKAPQVGGKIGTFEVTQKGEQGGWAWYTVSIPAIEIKELIIDSGKKQEFSIALQSVADRPVTSEFYSKERTSKNGNITKNGAYITLK